MSFSELQLIEPLLRAVAAEGYTDPTPIQQKAIPHLLAGRDLIGCARTGTGKTAAFALPMLQRLHEASAASSLRPGRDVRLLVLTPTRELAAQIGESFAAYGRHLPLRHTVIFGGVGQDPQVRALRAGVDILVATPGRLLDLMQQKLVRLDKIEVFILDEADRMLDMGFIHDVRRVIAALPRKRQTLLFSATMPEEIRSLAASILTDPVRVEAAPISSTAERIDQSVHFIDKADKRRLLVAILGDPAIARALVFTRTKHGANRVAEHLVRAGVVAEAIHGNKSQSARERALAGFKRGEVRALVATDIAARGIDIDGITHVFNIDLPEVPEQYVHRIGRTARAGASGTAISFCDGEERPLLQQIEKLIRERIPVADKVALPPGPPDAKDHGHRDGPPPQRGRHGQRSGGGGGHTRDSQPRQGSRPQSLPRQQPAMAHSAPSSHDRAPASGAPPVLRSDGGRTVVSARRPSRGFGRR